jgi:hypothetical protein
MNGHGVYTWPSGKKEYEGNFSDDKITGHGFLKKKKKLLLKKKLLIKKKIISSRSNK